MTLDEHLERTWPVAEAATEGKGPPDDRLTAFFYVLLRDHLPVGVARRIAVEIEASPKAYVLSDGPLAVLARDLAGRLR